MKKVLLFVLLIIFGCGREISKEENVFVSILPQKFFVEKIAGDDLNVNVMVRPGMSPATYEPLPNQLVELSNSKIYFAIGVPFEKILLEKIESNFKNVEIVNTQDGIKLRQIESHSDLHSHGHGNINYDPHVWLNPKLVKKQAENILSGLTEILPNRKNIYEENFSKFMNELDSLKLELRGILEKAKSKKFLVYHPTFGYFCDEYGLKQVPIEFEGKEPTAKVISEILNIIEKENINLLLVQKQFTSKLSEKIANISGIKIVQVDPLSHDYYDNLISIANIIADNANESIN